MRINLPPVQFAGGRCGFLFLVWFLGFPFGKGGVYVRSGCVAVSGC